MRARNDLEIKNALPLFHSENGDGNQLYYEEKGAASRLSFCTETERTVPASEIR